MKYYLNPKSQCSCFCGGCFVCAITAHMSEYLGHKRQSHQRQRPLSVPSHTNTHTDISLINFYECHNMHFKTLTPRSIEDDCSASQTKEDENEELWYICNITNEHQNI